MRQSGDLAPSSRTFLKKIDPQTFNTNGRQRSDHGFLGSTRIGASDVGCALARNSERSHVARFVSSGRSGRPKAGRSGFLSIRPSAPSAKSAVGIDGSVSAFLFAFESLLALLPKRTPCDLSELRDKRATYVWNRNPCRSAKSVVGSLSVVRITSRSRYSRARSCRSPRRIRWRTPRQITNNPTSARNCPPSVAIKREFPSKCGATARAMKTPNPAVATPNAQKRKFAQTFLMG